MFKNLFKRSNTAEKLSPKEEATKLKQPWVTVINTEINKENIKNGFFELDWNEYFILELRKNGYNGLSEEDIVDQWFTELCKNIGSEVGINMNNRNSGSLNKALRIDDDKYE